MGTKLEECARAVDRWATDVVKAGDQFDKDGDIYRIAALMRKLSAEIRAMQSIGATP